VGIANTTFPMISGADTGITVLSRWSGAVMQKGEPMTENERKIMMGLADTIQGEINRMCVTKELSEFDTMYGHAKKNLEKLSKMIYDARFRAERRNRWI
jgi:hypothetical protein